MMRWTFVLGTCLVLAACTKHEQGDWQRSRDEYCSALVVLRSEVNSDLGSSATAIGRVGAANLQPHAAT